MSDDTAKPNNEKEEFLRKLKNEISKNTEFVCEYHEGRDYIWVGTHDGLIGDKACHYEVFFYFDKLSVEAHFDDDDFEGVQKIKLTEEAEKKLIFKKWYGKRRRIIYKDNKDFEDRDLGDDNLLRKVINSLREMDWLIGAELRRIVCAQRNYVRLKVNDNLYKYIVKTKPFLSSVLLGLSIICLIVSFCGIDIKRKICEWQTILALVSLLFFILSVIIMLETDDERWIRFKLKNSVVDSMNGKELTKENCKILMDIMEL